jgi:phenylalanyl-tRNA synthetase beta chain
MKILLSWLKEYVNTDLPPEQIAKILTMAGLEVDSVLVLPQGDSVFEISLTPNLGHCSSVVGVARELAAATGASVVLPTTVLKEDKTLPIADLVSVQVEEPELCPRYACRMIKGLKVGPSPEWLKSRLEACGLRSVNNVVDVTNYVLLEMGQPLHAFDADKLYPSLDRCAIIVKSASEGQSFTTLDGKARILNEKDLMICDAVQPVALAGIMGGADSEVTDSTTNVLLESAWFSPGAVRRTSKKLGLMTDASKRFEREIDPNNVVAALDRATSLMQQVAGGNICKGLIDKCAQPPVEKEIACRLSRVNKLLGTQLGVSEIETCFQRLTLGSHWDGQDTFRVRIQTYRNDLKEEVDLIEEVARIYGYDNIRKETTKFSVSDLPHASSFLNEREMRQRLVGEGLQEFLTCDLIGPSIQQIVSENGLQSDAAVHVLNHTSVEQSVLRTSLLPGLLQVVKYNWDHQNPNINGFEIGRIHFKNGEEYIEQSVAGIILSGKSRPHHWDVKPLDYDFFDLKGIIENILCELKIGDAAFKATALSAFHPGRQAGIFVGPLEIGSFGEVHPAVQRRLDVPQRILFAEINLHELFQYRKKDGKMQQIPLYPGSERDWTLTLKDDVPIAAVIDAVYAEPSALLTDFSLLDVYQSDKLGKGLKNVTFRFFYRDSTKTIAQEAVDAEHARIVANATRSLHHALPNNP